MVCPNRPPQPLETPAPCFGECSLAELRFPRSPARSQVPRRPPVAPPQTEEIWIAPASATGRIPAPAPASVGHLHTVVRHPVGCATTKHNASRPAPSPNSARATSAAPAAASGLSVREKPEFWRRAYPCFQTHQVYLRALDLPLQSLAFLL